LKEIMGVGGDAEPRDQIRDVAMYWGVVDLEWQYIGLSP
jgi:hypothetical protein